LMKSKIHKILGVGLTLVLVVSLTIAIAAPVSAGENEWSSPAVPAKEGSDGDWLWSSDIDAGPGPLAMAIDGTLYCYAEIDTEEHVLQSTDDGRTWDKTDYYKDLEDELGDDPGAVVDFAISSLDADALYATDGDHVFYTKNAGDKWQTIADVSLELAIGDGTITSIDVSYDSSDDPFIFIGTEDSGTGSVYYVSQGGYPAQWTDLDVQAFDAGCDVYAVAASPEFADTDEIFALISGGANTTMVNNISGTISDWDALADLLDAAGLTISIDEASRICFPDDFDDDNYEMFVGISDGSGGGSVYRVDDDHSYNLGKEDSDILTDVVSLDVVGSFGATCLIAGSEDDTDNKVLYSTDDGDSWDDASKEPSGNDKAFVIMDEDFADSGIAWAACDGDDGAVSLTVDGGDLYNQIALVSTDIVSISDVSFSRNYAVDETMFLLTTDNVTDVDSLWRHSSEWERVFTSTLTTPELGDITKVMVSISFTKDETVYVALSGAAPLLYRSTDGGNDWDALSQSPDALTAWLVIDADTVIAGTSDEEVWKTANHGRRAWEDYDVDDAATIVSFSVSPNFMNDDTLLLGDDAGQVFISEDLGEEWDMVGDALAADTSTIVTFDSGFATNNFIYAASGDEIDRCEIDTGEDWADQEWNEFTTTKTLLNMVKASGLMCSADGTLYATDASAASANVGGAWRSLNPTDDMVDVVFEQMATGFELDANAVLSGLRLTAGTNVLWATDGAVTNELWTYEDFLATEVMLDEPWSDTGIDDTDQAWLKWEELNGADYYELRYTDNKGFDVHVVKVYDIEDLEYLVEDLDDGEMYYWKVRVQQDGPLLSRFSTVWNFTTKLAAVERTIEWMPENGAQGVIICPSFGWTRVSGASTYELELADNPDFTGATQVTTTINSWECDSDLAYSSTYYWRTRALKDSVVISAWRSGAFTTMAKPAPAVEVAPSPPAPQITLPAPQVILPEAVTPIWVWVIIAIGGALTIAVVVLIIRTRRAL